MKTLTEGYRYELENLGDKTQPGQVIQFYERRPLFDCQPGQDPVPTEQPSSKVNDGTTNEEVLAVLIDRLQFLNAKLPCKENEVALTHIETALLWLEKRTADRLKRGVEGQDIK